MFQQTPTQLSSPTNLQKAKRPHTQTTSKSKRYTQARNQEATPQSQTDTTSARRKRERKKERKIGYAPPAIS